MGWGLKALPQLSYQREAYSNGERAERNALEGYVEIRNRLDNSRTAEDCSRDDQALLSSPT